MKLNEILFLILWLFLGLLINHYVVYDGQKFEINLGRVVKPAVYALTVGVDCNNRLIESNYSCKADDEGCDSHAS